MSAGPREYDAAVDAALAAARAGGFSIIARIQDRDERQLSVFDGLVERQRSIRLTGVGIHAFTPDGSIGFASTDDLEPDAVREAVRLAGALAEAANRLEAIRSRALFDLEGTGVVRLDAAASDLVHVPARAAAQSMKAAQEALGSVLTGPNRTVRTTLRSVHESWRIVRSDGTDIWMQTPRASLRHEVSCRLERKIARAAGVVSGVTASSLLSDGSLDRLTRRTIRAGHDAELSATATPPPTGPYRVVLRHALAKGLAHEAIGHLCESDVDGSVLMRRGRLRLGERLARPTVSVVDGVLPGEYVQQPYSANGIPRQTVALIDGGVLSAGLGDLFSASSAGVPISGACRVGSYRDRPTPRMTNIRIEFADAVPLDADPDDLTTDDVLAALRRAGLLDAGQPTLYLTGYRGGQAHPRRGDFVFGADAAFDLRAGGAPCGPVSYSGLAERALASIVAGIGPVCTDAIGTCGKDGSSVSSSGGSHALLVLDADPDTIVSAAR